MKFFRVKPAKERKVVFLRKRWLAIPGALLCICALCLVTTLPSYVSASTTERQLPIYCVQRDYKTCALSFDAAWGNEDTQTLIDIFDKYNVKVTFFVVGEWVDKYPESVKALADAGHEVMGHSNDHAHFNTLSADQIVEDINTCNDKIEKITGKRPTLFRPPYGDYNDRVVTVSRAEGYECVQWSVDSLDWKNRGVEELVRQATRKIAPGDIVLFHNDSQFIVEALPTILKTYQDAGYTIVPVSEILLEGETAIDHTGRQHPVVSEQTPKQSETTEQI